MTCVVPTGSIRECVRFGGLIGDSNGEIRRSHSAVNLSGPMSKQGEDWSAARGSSGSIKASFASGNVSGNGNSSEGWLAAKLMSAQASPPATPSAKFPGPAPHVNGLVGQATTGSVTNSYYDSVTTGRSDTGSGEPKTTSELKTPTAYGTGDRHLRQLEPGLRRRQHQRRPVGLRHRRAVPRADGRQGHRLPSLLVSAVPGDRRGGLDDAVAGLRPDAGPGIGARCYGLHGEGGRERGEPGEHQPGGGQRQKGDPHPGVGTNRRRRGDGELYVRGDQPRQEFGRPCRRQPGGPSRGQHHRGADAVPGDRAGV